LTPKGRRCSLKSSDAKALMSKVAEQLGMRLSGFVDAKAGIEAVEAGKAELLLVDRKPVLFRTGERVYPTLLFSEALAALPRAVVDMGAVGHICNGADVMAPGIVRFEGDFPQGSLIVVVDVKYGKPLALGEVVCDSEAAKGVKKGVVIRNVHYVGDEVWGAVKALGD
jgi:PUA-domain protein